MTRLFILFAATLSWLVHAAGAAEPTGKLDLQWKQTETSLALLDGEHVIWQLNYDPNEGKPYFHPITAQDGTVLTALRPADHPWHRGLWWSWKYINGVNYWEEDSTGLSKGKTDLRNVDVTLRPDFSAQIRMDLAYQPVGGLAVLTEQREIEVSSPDASDGCTIIWRSTFLAGDDAVILNRTPIAGQTGGSAWGGYAGLSLRLSDAAKDWDFQDSENGRSEAAIHGRTARWVSYGAPGGPGFRIMDDDKSNPRFPPIWYASRKLRYLGPAFLFEAPFTLAPGKRLDFAYTLTINRRTGARAGVQKETVVNLATVPGLMKYNLESFRVAPGDHVTLRFRNDDDMLHNVVILKAPLDFGSKLGDALQRMGEDALAKHYIPDIPEVLFHTLLVEPGREQALQFVAPREVGDYPFFCTLPGHWAVMRGVMQVGESTGSNNATVRAVPSKRIPVEELVVGNTARVDRLSLPDCSPTALAVGLPGGMNYCFDVETLAVRYAWTGRYLDVGPNFAGRGGETVNVLGQRFNVGYAGTSISLESNPKPVLAFKGYRIEATPTLIYSIDGVEISQTVQVATNSISYTFEVQPTPSAIHFRVDPAGLRLSSSDGTWKDGVLTIPSNAATKRRFTVTIVHEK